MDDCTRLLSGSNLEQSTRKGYAYQLTYLERFLEENGLTIEALSMMEYRHFLDDRGWGNSAQRQSLAAIKWYLRAQSIPHELLDYSIPKRSVKPQRTLKRKQRDLLLDACRGRFMIRDQAIIYFLWETFARGFEACGALLDHLDLDNRVLVLETKAIAGKGRQWEEKRFGPELQQVLRAWLDVRHVFAHLDCKTIFISNTGQGLTVDGLACIFKRLSKRVGFKVSPHDFRRGGATNALKYTDSRYVMRQGGWKSAEVFLNYTRAAELDEYAKQMWGEDD